jgi:hypothetical protein
MYDWDEDEEGEEDDKWTEFTGKNVILFLVDGTEAMQVTDPEDGRTLYQKAVEAACATMKGKKSFFSFYLPLNCNFFSDMVFFCALQCRLGLVKCKKYGKF